MQGERGHPRWTPLPLPAHLEWAVRRGGTSKQGKPSPSKPHLAVTVHEIKVFQHGGARRAPGQLSLGLLHGLSGLSGRHVWVWARQPAEGDGLSVSKRKSRIQHSNALTRSPRVDKGPLCAGRWCTTRGCERGAVPVPSRMKEAAVLKYIKRQRLEGAAARVAGMHILSAGLVPQARRLPAS